MQTYSEDFDGQNTEHNVASEATNPAAAPTAEEKFLTPKHQGDLKGISHPVRNARGYYSEVRSSALVDLGGIPTPSGYAIAFRLWSCPFITLRAKWP